MEAGTEAETMKNAGYWLALISYLPYMSRGHLPRVTLPTEVCRGKGGGEERRKTDRRMTEN